MTPETELFIRKHLKPGKFVWCQHPRIPGSAIDEHQVCLDQETRYRSSGGESWGCTCKCHK